MRKTKKTEFALMKTLIWSFVVLTITFVATAQTTPCPVYYQRAVTQAETACDDINRNQACYGNNAVNLIPFSNDTEINFAVPGDLADVEVIRVLSLSALNTESGEWGISMMRLLANINPSNTDDVTLLLFGDVEMEDASEHTITQPITTNSIANVRQYPNTTATVIASFPDNLPLNAVGRTEDGSWIQIHDTASNTSGWIHSDLLTGDNIETLQVIESTQPYYGPMQAFYFRGESASGQVGCNAIPSDGLLIQTPEGVGRVTLWVNEVTIDFLSNSGATALVSPNIDDVMTVDMLEGTASVQSDNGGYVAVAGSSVTVETNTSSGDSPNVKPPQPINTLMANGEPTVILGREIITLPASPDAIAAANGLTPTQYQEVVQYGVVLTASEPANTASNAETTTGGTSTGDAVTNSGDASNPPQTNTNDPGNSGNSGNNNNSGSSNNSSNGGNSGSSGGDSGGGGDSGNSSNSGGGGDSGNSGDSGDSGDSGNSGNNGNSGGTNKHGCEGKGNSCNAPGKNK